MMQAMKVTAHMLTGKVATVDLYLPLDSILGWAWMTREHPELMAASASGIQNLVDPELPLERRGQGDDWYWACSFACGRPLREEIVYWHRRFDAESAERYVDFGSRRGKIDVGAGRFKGYRMPLVTYLVPRLEWYAVGDIPAVRELLTLITHIGKKRSQGYGRVARWTVEPWPEDLSHLRAIPDPAGNIEIGIRPPYWLPANRRRARITGDTRLMCNWTCGG